MTPALVDQVVLVVLALLVVAVSAKLNTSAGSQLLKWATFALVWLGLGVAVYGLVQVIRVTT